MSTWQEIRVDLFKPFVDVFPSQLLSQIPNHLEWRVGFCQLHGYGGWQPCDKPFPSTGSWISLQTHLEHQKCKRTVVEAWRTLVDKMDKIEILWIRWIRLKSREGSGSEVQGRKRKSGRVFEIVIFYIILLVTHFYRYQLKKIENILITRDWWWDKCANLNVRCGI